MTEQDLIKERELDIITDTENKLWYELDGTPDSRQGHFITFSDLINHLRLGRI